VTPASGSSAVEGGAGTLRGTSETAADTDKRNPPRSRKGVLTRARLLDAAKEIFEENGFLDARISDIAERAGLSHGSFYHYFDSKEQIFREVAGAVDERLSEPLEAVILDPTSTATPSERLNEAMRRHFESYRDVARIMGVIEQVSRYDEHVQAVRKDRNDLHRGMVANSIRRMQRRGIADAGLDADLAAMALGAMTWRFAEMWLVDGETDADFDHVVEQIARLFVNALGIARDDD
jgi:AcrR family transcriptional regulator